MSTSLSSLLTSPSLSLLRLSEPSGDGDGGLLHVESHESAYDFEPLGASQDLNPANSLQLSTAPGAPIEGGSIGALGQHMKPPSHSK